MAPHFALAWDHLGDMVARLVETLPFRLDESLVRSLVSRRLVWMRHCDLPWSVETWVFQVDRDCHDRQAAKHVVRAAVAGT